VSEEQALVRQQQQRSAALEGQVQQLQEQLQQVASVAPA